MESQVIKLAPTFDEWVKENQEKLGEPIVEYAIEVASKCALACAVIPSQRKPPTMYPFPEESVLETTKFGPRNRGRSATARPFYWAAFLLREVLGENSNALRAYLESLLDNSFEFWEFKKRIRWCAKQAMNSLIEDGCDSSQIQPSSINEFIACLVPNDRISHRQHLQ